MALRKALVFPRLITENEATRMEIFAGGTPTARLARLVVLDAVGLALLVRLPERLGVPVPRGGRFECYLWI